MADEQRGAERGVPQQSAEKRANSGPVTSSEAAKSPWTVLRPLRFSSKRLRRSDGGAGGLAGLLVPHPLLLTLVNDRGRGHGGADQSQTPRQR